MTQDGPAVASWPHGTHRLEDVYADLVLEPSGSGPHVALGMVASVDGAVAVDGRSRDLGAVGDAAAFRALRSACDVILVGAGTVRTEDYGPPSSAEDRIARRRIFGLADRPLLAVVTGSGELATDARLFSDPSYRPLVLTSTPDAADRLAEVADVVVLGEPGGSVDLARAVAVAAERGGPRILCEGGPRLNGALLDAGLVDEVFLTVAPTLVGGASDRAIVGASERLDDLELVSVIRVGDELLLRYRAAGPGETPAAHRG